MGEAFIGADNLPKTPGLNSFRKSASNANFMHELGSNYSSQDEQRTVKLFSFEYRKDSKC